MWLFFLRSLLQSMLLLVCRLLGCIESVYVCVCECFTLWHVVNMFRHKISNWMRVWLKESETIQMHWVSSNRCDRHTVRLASHGRSLSYLSSFVWFFFLLLLFSSFFVVLFFSQFNIYHTFSFYPQKHVFFCCLHFVCPHLLI